MALPGRSRHGYLTPSELVRAVQAGRIRVPPFQRPYKWRPHDVVLLFDSLRRGFPIGNLVFWRQPAQETDLELGPISFHAPAVSEADWILDGQQRIISIVGALTAPDDAADPRLRIVLDVSSYEFRSVTEPYDTDLAWLPVSRILDTKRLFAWFRLNSEWLTDEQIDRIDDIAAAIREYQIPTYTIVGEDESDIWMVFERLNTRGVSLTRSESLHALGAASRTAPITISSLARVGADLGFGQLTESVALRCVEAYLGAGRSQDPLSEMTDPAEFSRALHGTRTAVTHAIEFLRADGGIPHIRVLPSMYMLYVLTRFCRLHGRPMERTAGLLRRWIWRAAISGVTRQVSSHRAMAKIDDDPIASAERLLQSVPSKRPSLKKSPAFAMVGEDIGKLVLLTFLSHEPRDLRTGNVIDPTELLDKAPGRPWQLIVTQPAAVTKGAANRIVQGALDGATIADRLMVADLETAESHLLDGEALDLLRGGHVRQFLEYRRSLVEDAVNEHFDRMAEWGARDGRTLRDLLRSGGIE